MSDKFAPIRNRAAATLLAKGQLMTLIRLALATYDPLAPASAPSVAETCEVPGVVLPRSKGTVQAFDERILDDPDRLAKFRYVIISGKDITFRPQPRDYIRTAEGDYKIDGLVPIDPAGEGAIIFQCYCSLDTPFITLGLLIWEDSGVWDDSEIWTE